MWILSYNSTITVVVFEDMTYDKYHVLEHDIALGNRGGVESYLFL